MRYSANDASGTYRRRRSRRRRALRATAAAAVVGAVLAGGAAGWIGLRAAAARDQLHGAAAMVSQLRRDLTAGDADAARGNLSQARAAVLRAREEITDPLWAAGSHAPAVGANLRAIDTVVAVTDRLVTDGLAPLVGGAGRLRLESLTVRGGRFDARPLRAVSADLARAAAALADSAAHLGAIDTGTLLPPVARAVEALRAQLRPVVREVRTASHAAALLPTMLGDPRPRTYLVLFQNPAEVRATGGMPGAYAVLRVTRGAVRLVGQGTAARLGTFPRPVLTLDPQRRALYGDKPGTFPADVNFTPHYPTAAQLFREMYRRRTGTAVDGVVATDPVALAYLLQAVGPVAVPGGPRLTARTAVRTLLRDAYARYDRSADQDRYFAAAARATFTALTGRTANPRALLRQLGRAAGERRLLVWSADPREQRRLAATTLGGVLPDRDGERPTVGVFLNDGSGAKLGYYLTRRAELTLAGCRPDRRRPMRLTVQLGSTAPARGLPPYVLGLGLAGDPYTLRTNVSVVSPPGGSLTHVLLDGRRVAFGSGAESRRAVGVVTVDLRPGQTRTLEVGLLTGVPADGRWTAAAAPRLWTTPGVTPWRTATGGGGRCPAA